MMLKKFEQDTEEITSNDMCDTSADKEEDFWRVALIMSPEDRSTVIVLPLGLSVVAGLHSLATSGSSSVIKTRSHLAGTT